MCTGISGFTRSVACCTNVYQLDQAPFPAPGSEVRVALRKVSGAARGGKKVSEWQHCTKGARRIPNGNWERHAIPLWVCVLVEVLYKRGQYSWGTWDEPGHNHDSNPYPCSGNLQWWVAQSPTDISEWLGFGLSQNLPPIFSQCFDCGRNWDRPTAWG